MEWLTIRDTYSSYRARLDRFRSVDFNLVNLCVALNASNFHFTVAQTRDVVLDFISTIDGLRREELALLGAGCRVFTYQHLVESQAVATFRQSFLAKGRDVDLKDAAALFNFLLRYTRNFRKEGFRQWYAEKRQRREARGKRWKEITAEYWKDFRAMEAEMKEDCEKEAELLGLRLMGKDPWSARSSIVISRRNNNGWAMFAERLRPG